MRRKGSLKPLRQHHQHQLLQEPADCYEGERLDSLLLELRRSLDSARLRKGDLPEKIWFKQQFSIGVNDVTRVLERMQAEEIARPAREAVDNCPLPRAPLVPLQAVLLAYDCHPKWLIKHIPALASLKQVPIIYVKDNRGGSLRLGGLVNLKAAMAVGVKARGSEINGTLEKFLNSVRSDTSPREELLASAQPDEN